MSEPSYLTTAKAIEATPLRVRFSAFDVTVRFFLENVAGRWLLRLCRKGYKPLKTRFVGGKLEDDVQTAETVIRQQFIPLLADPVFDPDRPASTSFAYPFWLASVMPAGLEPDEFGIFVKTCINTIDNYKRRWEKEQILLRGAMLIAIGGWVAVFGMMVTKLAYSAAESDLRSVLTILLCWAICKLMGGIVSLESWPQTTQFSGTT